MGKPNGVIWRAVRWCTFMMSLVNITSTKDSLLVGKAGTVAMVVLPEEVLACTPPPTRTTPSPRWTCSRRPTASFAPPPPRVRLAPNTGQDILRLGQWSVSRRCSGGRPASSSVRAPRAAARRSRPSQR
ncbi:hypothetical protein PR002_g20655 [Phytophthora rubi]|uniref:Uncharacterized protein n=1 Tax=Phytophthora rubi TaxID=129364 RepID=A0A6A3JBU6_9STRA|nr:hypothetical protein PR002_g20655 [Phytophthora rubi]